MHNDTNKSSAPAVSSSINILKFLSRRSTNKCTLTEISTSIDINKSTCFRILKTLHSENIVSYDEQTKTYSLGSRLITLGARAAEFNDYISVIKPFLVELKTITGMVALLVQPTSKNRMVNLCVEEPVNNILVVSLRVGDWFQLTSGASGICQLAYFDPEILEEIVRNSKFNSPDYPKSITNIQQLNMTLDSVRQKGYCVTHEEYFPKPMIVTFASPIFDHKAHPILSIAVVGLYSSLSQDTIEDTGPLISEFSKKITHAIGGTMPSDELVSI